MTAGAGATVVHLLSQDLARGAQAYARSLVDALGAGPDEHHLATLFTSDATVARPDLPLGVRSGWARDAGLDPRALWHLRAAVRRAAPDVVVSHGGEPLKYAALVAPPGLRLVYYKIGIGAEQLGGRARLAFHRRLVAQAWMVAAVSAEAMEEARTRLAVPEDRLVLIPNGRDGRVYRPRGPRPPGPVRLLFVGHLVPTKRPERFLAVVRALRARGVRLEAALVGDGPLAGALAAEAAGCGASLLGRRPDVPALLAATDVLVFTSVAEGEGMPGVLIEAGLAGLPVVTTAVPGASAVVRHRETGYVVGVEDLDGLVQATERLATDATLRTAMGSAARAHCLRHFSMEASAKRWQPVIDQVLGRHGEPLSPAGAP